MNYWLERATERAKRAAAAAEKEQKVRDDAELNRYQTTARKLNHHDNVLNDLAERESLATNFSMATAYFNVIMLGGYAATFTLWNYLSEYMTAKETMLIGLLLTVSVFFFAGFEVFKVVFASYKLSRAAKLIDKREGPGANANLKSAARTDVVIKQSRLWFVPLFIAVISGFVSGLILLYVLICELIAAI